MSTISFKDIPILLVDVANFSAGQRPIEVKRALLRCLQDVLTQSAKFFMPFGDPWAKWKRHGTGDGYYFLFDSLGPQVALEYALSLSAALRESNHRSRGDIELRLRAALTFGDVELVEDQLLSDAFIRAERLVNDPLFKRHALTLGNPAPLIISTLFHHLLNKDIDTRLVFAHLKDLVWHPVSVTDKHGESYRAYTLDPPWDEKDGSRPADSTTPSPSRPPFRILILVACSLIDPLPEAIEMAKVAVRDLVESALQVSVRVAPATVAQLRAEAQEGFDLLIFYGHGGETGTLAFADGSKDFSALAEPAGLQSFWQNLTGFLVFACYGDRFARSLPCPWVAFREPILRTAPRGFLHALIGALTDNSLDRAIDEALSIASGSMKSNLPQAFCKSSKPFRPVTISSGRPRCLRQSPGMSGRFDVDFGSIEYDNRLYPEHDPFVGRTADLQRLLELPDPASDQSLQRLLWVHGDAGLGKSALLRQFVAVARDLIFQPEHEPLWLLHAYCYNCVQPSDLETLLCQKAARLYALTPPPATIADLFLALRTKPGTHVWILDDLTYLAHLDRRAPAYQVASALSDHARVAALPMQLVLSARFKGPNEWGDINVQPLTLADATRLARTVSQRAHRSFDEPEYLGATQLFSRCGGSTAHFKRALLLAVEREMPYEDYVRDLETPGSLDNQQEIDLSQQMIVHELSQLQQLEPKHGFSYGIFLKLYMPLILRSGQFTQTELERWFDNRFHISDSKIPLSTAYRNGLAYLARLGFLGIRRGDEATAFYMPPNQRLPMRQFQDISHALPDAIPFRAPKARLSQALESVRKGSWPALGELLQMEEDYGRDVSHPEAAEAVMVAMRVRAELTGVSDKEQAISIYDHLIHRFADRPETALAEQVASALVNKGATLGSLNRSEEEIGVYDEVVRRYGERPETALAEQVASALFNKGVRLGSLNRSGDALASFRRIAELFSSRQEHFFIELLAKINTLISS